MVQTTKFSQFTAAGLLDPTAVNVGLSGGVNVKNPKFNSWTSATRPSPPYNGLLGYNTDEFMYEFYNQDTASWSQLQDDTSGDVNPGLTNQLAYYAANGNTISGLATANNGVLVTSSIGAPSISSTLPNAVQINITALGTITTGAWQGTAINGQYINYDSVNLQVTANQLNTIQNINTGASPTFVDLQLTSLTGLRLVESSSGNSLESVTDLTTFVQGTSLVITSTSNGTGGTVISIDPGYIGQTSINTLGLVDVGTWQATLIAPEFGGSGVSGPTAHGILVAEHFSAFNPIVLTNGQLLIGSTGADPVAASLTPGTGINITPSADGITITNTGTIGGITSLTGDVTASGPGAAAATISANAVTYAKFQQVAASSLVGNPTGSLANAEGITLASSLSFSGTTLEINPTYVGQTSITTLGTIGTGVWQGTVVAGQYGGTGIANTGQTINLGSHTTGYVLTSDSSGNATWQVNTALGAITSLTGDVTASGPGAAAATIAANAVTYAKFQQVAASSLVGNPTGSLANAEGITLASSLSFSGSTLEISPSYLGQTSITTLGTISSGTWNATVITGQYGGTGVANTGLTINLSSGATGKVLSSDSSGNATWTALSGVSVTSVTGTANQIVPSSSVGAITLSFPATGGLSIGSYQATTPPTGGLIMPGLLGIGTSSPSYPLHINATSTSGIVLRNSGAATNTGGNSSYGIYSDTTVAIASGTALGYGFYLNPRPVSGAGTMATCYGFYIDVGTTNTVPSNAYSLYVNTPNYGTSKYCAYFEGITGINDTSPGSTLSVVGSTQIGFSSGTLAPSNGLVVSGQSNFGSSSTVNEVNVAITNATQSIALNINGTSNYSVGNNVGIYLDQFYILSASNTNSYTAIACSPTFNTSAGTLSGGLSCVTANPQVIGNVGILTNVYGFYFVGGSLPAGTVNNSYGGYFANPAFGTNRQALYSDSISIGYSAINLFGTNNLIVSGIVGIGTNSPTQLLSLASSSNANIILTSTGTNTLNIANAAFASGQYAIYTSTNSQLVFGANSGLIMTLTPSEKVGILDIAPGTTLSVVGNMQVGFSSGTLAPTNSLVVANQLGVGTSTPDVSAGIQLGGTWTTLSSGYLYGIINASNYSPPSGAGGQIRGISSQSAYTALASQTISTIMSFYATTGCVAQNGATISNAYGMFIDTGSATLTGTGSVGSGVNLYIAQPAFGTTAYALDVQGGMINKYVQKSANYQITTADFYIGYSSTAAAYTATMPPNVPAAGWTVTVTDESGGAGTNNITVSGNGHNINGASTAVIANNYGSLTIRSNGTTYNIV